MKGVHPAVETSPSLLLARLVRRRDVVTDVFLAQHHEDGLYQVVLSSCVGFVRVINTPESEWRIHIQTRNHVRGRIGDRDGRRLVGNKRGKSTLEWGSRRMSNHYIGQPWSVLVLSYPVHESYHKLSRPRVRRHHSPLVSDAIFLVAPPWKALLVKQRHDFQYAKFNCQRMQIVAVGVQIAV